MKKEVPIGLSNRHIHLTEEHINELFGEENVLTRIKDLSQPGQYACAEKVDIIGPKGTLKGVRVIGPARSKTQVEILLSDAYTLGVKPPIKDSGDLCGCPSAKIVGPKGEIEVDECIMVAARHIHMHVDDAKEFGVEDGQKVKVKIEGERGLVFDNVLIRVSPKYALEMHIDIEEGNAAGASNGTMVELIK